MTTRVPIYSDLNAAYRGNVTYSLIYDITSVMQSMYYLLHTRKTQKFFDPTYGTDLYNLLFELMNQTSVSSFVALLKDIELQEPRVHIDIQGSSVKFDPNNHVISFDIKFSIDKIQTNVYNYRELMYLGNL